MGSSPEAHLARTREWPNPNPKPNPNFKPNLNPNHNPKTILARCVSGLDPATWAHWRVADLRFYSPQPDTSLHCKATNTG